MVFVVWIALLPFGAASGQPAELEIGRLTGECAPVFAATSQDLRLHQKPDLRAPVVVLRYQRDWEVPYGEGKTRVLRFGELKVLKPEPLEDCDSDPTDGVKQLIVGETVDYLYGLGEGFGQIGVRGGVCSVPVAEDFAAFEVVRLPEIQFWLDVRLGDGSSPGWLLLDNTQTRVAGARC